MRTTATANRGRPAQHARAVAHVLQQGIEPVQAVRLAACFLDRRDYPEAASGRPDCLPLAHPPREVLLDGHLQVGVELVVEIPFGRGAAKARPQARQPLAEDHGVTSRNRATMAAVRSHRSTWARSSRRPASVSA